VDQNSCSFNYVKLTLPNLFRYSKKRCLFGENIQRIGLILISFFWKEESLELFADICMHWRQSELHPVPKTPS